jgi:uncharacterized SAM-binding protein YcdF (DUF218 family)
VSSASSPKRGRRARRWLIGAATILLISAVAYTFHVPLLTWIGGQLVHRDSLESSDAILVLAGGVFDRELEAADLFNRGLASQVLLTAEPDPAVFAELRSRGVRVETSLELRQRVLNQLGVPRERVQVLPGIVAATVHEAEAAARWCDQNQARSLIVVTSTFHTARARHVFRQVFGDRRVTLRFAPASKSDFQPGTWWRQRNTLRDGLFELQKTLFYRLRY